MSDFLINFILILNVGVVSVHTSQRGRQHWPHINEVIDALKTVYPMLKINKKIYMR